jgi:hypothetical protein
LFINDFVTVEITKLWTSVAVESYAGLMITRRIVLFILKGSVSVVGFKIRLEAIESVDGVLRDK